MLLTDMCLCWHMLLKDLCLCWHMLLTDLCLCWHMLLVDETPEDQLPPVLGKGEVAVHQQQLTILILLHENNLHNLTLIIAAATIYGSHPFLHIFVIALRQSEPQSLKTMSTNVQISLVFAVYFISL